MNANLERHDWIALGTEAAFDADREIVDAHHHLWDRGGSTYLAEQLQADTSATHNVTQTVFVECRADYDRDAPPHLAPVGETAFVAEQATRCEELGGSSIGAIVSFADMALGAAVEEVLAAHEAAGAGLFRGIRHATAFSHDDAAGIAHTGPTEGLMGEPNFRAGVAQLGAMGYSFDAWLFHPQVPELTAMARALPEVPIVLDHLGAPLGVGSYAGKSAEIFAELRVSLTDLATCPNVVLKLGGIGMDNYYGGTWIEGAVPPNSDDVVARYGDQIRWSIDLFGPDRCLFESNFPVDRQTLPYSVLWNGLQKIAASYDDAEQNAMFSGTARRVYKIDSNQ